MKYPYKIIIALTLIMPLSVTANTSVDEFQAQINRINPNSTGDYLRVSLKVDQAIANYYKSQKDFSLRLEQASQQLERDRDQVIQPLTEQKKRLSLEISQLNAELLDSEQDQRKYAAIKSEINDKKQAREALQSKIDQAHNVYLLKQQKLVQQQQRADKQAYQDLKTLFSLSKSIHDKIASSSDNNWFLQQRPKNEPINAVGQGEWEIECHYIIDDPPVVFFKTYGNFKLTVTNNTVNGQIQSLHTTANRRGNIAKAKQVRHVVKGHLTGQAIETSRALKMEITHTTKPFEPLKDAELIGFFQTSGPNKNHLSDGFGIINMNANNCIGKWRFIQTGSEQ